MASFHEEPTKMDDYGYGQDHVSNTLIYANSTQNDRDPKKKRGPTRDFLDRLCVDVNYDLLVAKTFYFFFFAAFGSLFPLIAVYFKQLGMNPSQAGMLIGFRPFVELLAGPFWGNVAERWKKWKTILLFSLFCWVTFTLALAFVQPPAYKCLVHNKTGVYVADPYSASNLAYAEIEDVRSKRWVRMDTSLDNAPQENKKRERFLYEPQWLPLGRMKREAEIASFEKRDNTGGKEESEDNDDDGGKDVKQYEIRVASKIGMSPLPLSHKNINNLNEAEARNLVSPPFSAVVYRNQDIQTIFLELLILQILGEFLSTPALTMADTATLGYLEDDIENYGRQRMYGSFGWAIAMFFVGIALAHSNIFPNHPCGTEHLVDRNYMTCYAVFSVLMSCAFFTATQFRFKEVDSAFQTIPLSELKTKVIGKVQQTLTQINRKDNPPASDVDTLDNREQKVHISLHDEEGRIRTGDMISDVQAAPGEQPQEPAAKPSTFVPRGQPGQAGTLPQWISVLRMFATIQYSSMFFILWYMGFGIGLVFAFLFWHLQDLRGTPVLFGISSVINHVSEITAYFFIRNLVSKFGHINIIYAGLLGNVARFIYISYLESPWWVLPFEFVQGLTHAAVWAAGCSYMTQAVPMNVRPTAQMILQSLHHAFGRGCGTIFGGILISSYGTQSVFRGYGIACIFVFVGYFALNFFYVRHLTPIIGAPQPTNEIETEAAYLTPHGVPGGGISHSISNSRIGDGASQQGGPSQSNGYYEQSGGGLNQNQHQGYRDNQTSGFGSGGGDYQYGYNKETAAGKLTFNDTGSSKAPLQEMTSPSGGSDMGVIRRKFKAYEDAMTSTELQKPLTQKLILHMAPKPSTHTVLEQPENRDLSLMEDSSGNWLY